MEWKIGEIKQVNGEWYQCIRSSDCPTCDLRSIQDCRLKFPCEPLRRNDCEEVIFKKLEKVGEPFLCKNHSTGKDFLLQEYKFFDSHAFIKDNIPINHTFGLYGNPNLFIEELKQNQEDMEENKMYDAKEDMSKFDKVVDECLFGKDKLNLKPFDIQKAKQGKPVCTRDGRKARIICFNAKTLCDYPIIALVENADNSIYEAAYSFSDKGEYLRGNIRNIDLVMPLEEHE